MKRDLRTIRKVMGLAQKEMADLIGLKTKTYQLKERGEIKMFFWEMEKISEVTGIKMSDIILPEVWKNEIYTKRN